MLLSQSESPDPLSHSSTLGTFSLVHHPHYSYKNPTHSHPHTHHSWVLGLWTVSHCIHISELYLWCHSTSCLWKQHGGSSSCLSMFMLLTHLLDSLSVRYVDRAGPQRSRHLFQFSSPLQSRGERGHTWTPLHLHVTCPVQRNLELFMGISFRVNICMHYSRSTLGVHTYRDSIDGELMIDG